MRRVVITGLGAVTPLGVGAHLSWTRLLAGHSGITSTSAHPHPERFSDLPCQIAAFVPRGKGSSIDGGWDVREWLERGEERRMAVFSQYAVAGAEMALRDAGLKEAGIGERGKGGGLRMVVGGKNLRVDTKRVGVCIGSGIGSFEDAYETTVAYRDGGYKKVSPLFVPRLLINLAAGHVSMKHSLHGPNHSPSTACTTAAHAIGDASRFITFSDADIMLAGGSESCIHPLSLAGFCRAKSLCTTHNHSPATSSRPFDKFRSGFVMGEGAGVMVLEELEHAKRRGARIYAEVLGYGLSGDAYHITSPPDSGEGAYLSMARALCHAKVSPREVDYINAHATSTPMGDKAENRAIRRLFLQGEEEESKVEETKDEVTPPPTSPSSAASKLLLSQKHAQPSSVAVSSSKGSIGHLLGAAGVVESIFTVLAIQNDVLPPTLNLDNPGDVVVGNGSEAGPEDGEKEKEKKEENEFTLNYVPKVPQKKVVNFALSNSFGFGGTNASLCFGKYKEVR